LMADMIRFGPSEGTYVVRFPNDGAEYNINEGLLDEKGIHDKALWATLIECAQTQKFPNDNGGLLSDGLGCLTGRKAETVTPSAATEQELAGFIDGAVKSQNPIVAGTYQGFGGLPYIVFPSHAYTIIGYDTGSCMVKLRNPHGANSERFSLESDPNHRKFEQLDDGVFKMHISLFQHYFAQVARSFI
ncbi:MAG TPA: C2 family cysteine protease, partial [Chroococcales cyanobacterium]